MQYMKKLLVVAIIMLVIAANSNARDDTLRLNSPIPKSISGNCTTIIAPNYVAVALMSDDEVCQVA
jgi:hypothetical protein